MLGHYNDVRVVEGQRQTKMLWGSSGLNFLLPLHCVASVFSPVRVSGQISKSCWMYLRSICLVRRRGFCVLCVQVLMISLGLKIIVAGDPIPICLWFAFLVISAWVVRLGYMY